MKLSEHFSLYEFTFSQTATRKNIDNTPSANILNTLRITAAMLEDVRRLCGNTPIKITSGYRCEELNIAVGGSLGSQHMQGEAADIICPRFDSDPKALAMAIKKSEIPFDQLIYEGGWVHLSWSKNLRRSILTAKFRKGYGVSYYDGIV